MKENNEMYKEFVSNKTYNNLIFNRLLFEKFLYCIMKILCFQPCNPQNLLN